MPTIPMLPVKLMTISIVSTIPLTPMLLAKPTIISTTHIMPTIPMLPVKLMIISMASTITPTLIHLVKLTIISITHTILTTPMLLAKHINIVNASLNSRNAWKTNVLSYHWYYWNIFVNFREMLAIFNLISTYNKRYLHGKYTVDISQYILL